MSIKCSVHIYLKMKISIVFVLLVALSYSSRVIAEEARPGSVLIIGGGPAGLATAIEARMQGYCVTIVERRDTYTRPQWLFLFDSSLELFETWNVFPPLLRIADLGDGRRMGVIQIHHLEKALEQRALALGVIKIQGEFQGFGSSRTALISTSDRNRQSLAYDVIVGADGLHSCVRDSLNIRTNHLGSGFGAVAIIVDPNDSSNEVEISKPINIQKGFVRRIKVPSASIVFAQFPSESSASTLEKSLRIRGWNQEAQAIASDKAFVLDGIKITLQQAQAFANEEKAAILVGEAAGAASFFEGSGANTAFKAAGIAGRFFKELRSQDPQKCYRNFYEAMKETTDALIEGSAFLFAGADS